MAVGMFYHAYGCGAFALSRATGYRVLRKQRKHGDVLVCGFPASQLDTVLQRIREAGEVVKPPIAPVILYCLLAAPVRVGKGREPIALLQALDWVKSKMPLFAQ